MSGSLLVARSCEAGAKTSERLQKKLGLTLKDIRNLQELPILTLLEAQAEMEASDRVALRHARLCRSLANSTVADNVVGTCIDSFVQVRTLFG